MTYCDLRKAEGLLMKILIDARSLGQTPSGIGMYIARFVEGLLAEEDMRPILLTDVCQSAEMQALERRGVPVRCFGRVIRKGPDLWRYFRFLKRMIGEEKPELFWEPNNLLPIRLKNPYGKYVVTLHDIFPITLPEQHSKLFCLYFRYGLRKTLRCCDALLFDTETMQREIGERFARARALPQYVSYVVVPPSRGEALPRKDYFLYIGNLEKRKGTDLLLEAHARYCRRGGTAELILAGKLRDAEVKTRLEQAQREGKVRYLGYITDEERTRRYRECGCLVFPSRAEGFGLPLVEALDCGAPVIASRLKVFEELAGDSARYFPLEGGAEALCEAMLEAAPAEGPEWDNPFTAEKLSPGLAAFFRSLTRKTLRLDGQALMEENPAGIGTLAAEMARGVIRDGRFACEIVAFSRGRTAGQLALLNRYGLEPERIRLCRFFRRGIYLRIWHYLPLPWRWFFGGKADVNLFWNFDVPPGVRGKSVVYVHDMTCMRYPETMDKTVRRLLGQNLRDTCRRADRIVTLTAFSKAEIASLLGVEEEKIRVVPGGVDSRSFRPLADKEAALAPLREKYGIQGPYFLYVGTLEPRKNIERMLRAYAALAERCEDCPQLVLGGRKGWLYDSMLALLESEPLRGRVVVTDYLPREEIPVLMGGALAFVFPSLYEGFGLPPLEAMACGTPVIVSDRASLPEVVGEAGLVVPVENEEALCEAMLRLAREPELREELSRRGLERAAQFSWKSAADKLLAVCEELAEEE